MIKPRDSSALFLAMILLVVLIVLGVYFSLVYAAEQASPVPVVEDRSVSDDIIDVLRTDRVVGVVHRNRGVMFEGYQSSEVML